MNIEKIENGFTNIVTPGRFALFIHMKKDGAFVNIDEIYEQCIHYSRIVFCGENPLEQKEELSKLCKKLTKNIDSIKIEIHTNGSIKPVDVSGYINSVTYNVRIDMASSGIDYKKRINAAAMTWFSEVGANFIFALNKLEDLDEVTLLANTYGIRKSQTILMPVNNIDKIFNYCKLHGYSITMEVVW